MRISMKQMPWFAWRFRRWLRVAAVLALAGGLFTGCAKSNPVMPFQTGNTIPSTYLLDDFESGKNPNYFGGSWYVYSDAITLVFPRTDGDWSFYPQGSPLSPKNSFRLRGTFGPKDKVVYAGFGTTLDPASQAVDLTVFQGIRFTCTSSAGTLFIVRIRKQSSQESYEFKVRAGTAWQWVQLPFSAFQRFYGIQPVPGFFNDVTDIQWHVDSGQTVFDFQIDDVQFY